MSTKDLLDAGRLGDAIAAVTQDVKARPTDTSARTSLFELLCLSGDLDRALKQLEAIGLQAGNFNAEVALQVYRDLLAAEQARRMVFHAGALPKFYLTPPAYADHYVMLVSKLATSPVEAVALLPEAEELAPSLQGSLGGRRFSSFRDADDRFGPMLEVFHGANYLWLPLEQIRRLQVTPPTALRDTIWAHATVETYEGSVGDVYLPVRYVDTDREPNDRVRLGRITEWRAVEEQLVCGVGPRVFLVDGEEVPLLDLRDVRFDAPAPVPHP